MNSDAGIAQLYQLGMLVVGLAICWVILKTVAFSAYWSGSFQGFAKAKKKGKKHDAKDNL